MITHYDLFAGIGGFSLALDEVFHDRPTRHVFCEWESFPTAVLRKHWPDGEFWGDIAELVAHTESEQGGRVQQSGLQPDSGTEHKQSLVAHTESFGAQGRNQQHGQSKPREDGESASDSERQRLQGNLHGHGENVESVGETTHPGHRDGSDEITILTGGFPCQPFSAAGRRRGTSDDRYKWPEMFEVIRNVRPTWVIAENVRGLVTWNDGMVLEQVCTDLESEGYEVQPLIIPAVAVNAPHRRDRVWIIANRRQPRPSMEEPNARGQEWQASRTPQPEMVRQGNGPVDAERHGTSGELTPNSISGRRRTGTQGGSQSGLRGRQQRFDAQAWQRNWREVAFATCHDGVDDGLSRIVDGVPYSRAKWRKESLKAYGNAIVPQVAMEIFKAIREAECSSP